MSSTVGAGVSEGYKDAWNRQRSEDLKAKVKRKKNLPQRATESL
jgi:hypothetical protein